MWAIKQVLSVILWQPLVFSFSNIFMICFGSWYGMSARCTILNGTWYKGELLFQMNKFKLEKDLYDSWKMRGKRTDGERSLVLIRLEDHDLIRICLVKRIIFSQNLDWYFRSWYTLGAFTRVIWISMHVLFVCMWTRGDIHIYSKACKVDNYDNRNFLSLNVYWLGLDLMCIQNLECNLLQLIYEGNFSYINWSKCKFQKLEISNSTHTYWIN